MIEINEFQELRQSVTQKVAERDVYLQQLNDHTKQLTRLREREMTEIKARAVIQEVAKKTQQKLEFHISKLVTTALLSVSKAWPEFVARIEIKRNKTECSLLFNENGTEYKPIDGSGGGPLDVASFALRVANWSLQKNASVLILDEPFKYVSPDLQHKVSEMIEMLSKKLGIQILMISHQEEINLSSDKTFVCHKENKVSKIKEL